MRLWRLALRLRWEIIRVVDMSWRGRAWVRERRLGEGRREVSVVVGRRLVLVDRLVCGEGGVLFVLRGSLES